MVLAGATQFRHRPVRGAEEVGGRGASGIPGCLAGPVSDWIPKILSQSEDPDLAGYFRPSQAVTTNYFQFYVLARLQILTRNFTEDSGRQAALQSSRYLKNEHVKKNNNKNVKSTSKMHCTSDHPALCADDVLMHCVYDTKRGRMPADAWHRSCCPCTSPLLRHPREGWMPRGNMALNAGQAPGTGPPLPRPRGRNCLGASQEPAHALAPANPTELFQKGRMRAEMQRPPLTEPRAQEQKRSAHRDMA